MKTKPYVMEIGRISVPQRRTWFFHTMWIGWLALASLGLTQAADTTTKPTVSALSWLAGTWTFERNGRVITERWTAPTGGMMIGTSQTVANERTVEYEFVVLRADESGNVVYAAKPSRQPEATFNLMRVTDREAVFENPRHDFPQRITYTLRADGTLLAAIEGTKDGKTRRVEFPYRPGK